MISIVVFTGCFSTIVAVGSVTSAISTSQEIEEEYNNDIVWYVQDKTTKLYRYIKSKSSK